MPTEKQLAYWKSRKGMKLSEHQLEMFRKVNIGRKLTEEHKKNLSQSHLGKKMSEENRLKMSIARKGIKLSDEVKKNMSNAQKGKVMSKEARIKIGLASLGRKMKPENIEKQRIRMIGNTRGFRKGQVSHNKGKHPSEETLKKLRESHLGQKSWNKGIKGIYHHTEEWKRNNSKMMMGKKMSIESRNKLRISTIEYLKKVCGEVCPRIGTNEKRILDSLQIHFKYHIHRQYEVEGYFLDGYIPELRLAIEIDEKPKNKDKDFERQKFIEDKLDCKFIRIKDYD